LTNKRPRARRKATGHHFCPNKWSRRCPVSNQASWRCLNRPCPEARGTEEGVRIQINSDKSIAVDTRVIHFVGTEVNRALGRFGGKLTRVEVHLSDVNSHKFGTHDKRCLIEARPARHRPRTATHSAATVRQAVAGALSKLRTSLQTFFGRLEKRGEDTVTDKRRRPAVGRRRAPAASHASSPSVTADGAGRVTRPQHRRSGKSSVAAKKSGSHEGTGHARGPKKKAIYQARRKSWPAR
jgi:hypothetical protein